MDDTKNGGTQGVSLGRVCFLAVLGVLFLVWAKSLAGDSPELPPGIMEVFFVLAAYVFGTKTVSAVKLRFKNGKVAKVGGDGDSA